jgi:hypothetical protein
MRRYKKSIKIKTPQAAAASVPPVAGFPYYPPLDTPQEVVTSAVFPMFRSNLRLTLIGKRSDVTSPNLV